MQQPTDLNNQASQDMSASPMLPHDQDASGVSPFILYSNLLDPYANSTVRRRRVRDGGKRNKLSFEVVLAIFERRPMRSEVDGTFVPCAELCRELSEQYKVQARTIRDIWNRRSWGFVTRPLWTLAEIAAEQGIQARLHFGSHHIDPVQMRKRGRPHGAKDTVKRRRKTEEDTPNGAPIKQEEATNGPSATPSNSSVEGASAMEVTVTEFTKWDSSSTETKWGSSSASCEPKWGASCGADADAPYPLWEEPILHADPWAAAPLQMAEMDESG